ncbi:MAG: META domain-containing protein [Cyanobacteriota bacterium]|nr:META domain-containing protein [Cyanobacteriota bacterium]
MNAFRHRTLRGKGRLVWRDLWRRSSQRGPLDPLAVPVRLVANAREPVPAGRPERGRKRLPALAVLSLLPLPALSQGLIPTRTAAQPPAAPSQLLANAPASRPPAPMPSTPLAGSTWQLVALQSMDDAVGRRAPPNPAAYTLRFGADGTASLRLDCNRGQAPWQATIAQPTPSTARAEGSGTLRFGPLALTRALCPPPSLSDTVAGQLPFVRSFLLRHNRLSLSLLADGGILEWQPLSGVPFRAVLSPQERRAILAGLDPATRRALSQNPTHHRAVVARLDLNADGREELFAYLLGPLFCGTGGCTLQLFTPETRSGGWRLVQAFPITRLPLIASPATSRGWRDLWRPEAGGGVPASLVRERFDGQRYRPTERRSPQPTPAGTAVLVGDPGLAEGAPL